MPGSIRLFVTSPLHEGASIDATPGQAHYLAHVMRRAAGDLVALFDGEHGEWRARIDLLRRGGGRFLVEAQTRAQEPEPDLWLAFAPLKREATDLVVEKATELGVAALLPVLTERGNTVRLNPERLAAIAREAAEQCERLTVPRIASPAPLRALLGAWPALRTLVAAVERAAGAAPPAGLACSALLVGPEGGFTGAELDVLRAAPFVVTATLGPRILRAETAAIVGLALMQARSGGATHADDTEQ